MANADNLRRREEMEELRKGRRKRRESRKENLKKKLREEGAKGCMKRIK